MHPSNHSVLVLLSLLDCQLSNALWAYFFNLTNGMFSLHNFVDVFDAPTVCRKQLLHTSLALDD